MSSTAARTPKHRIEKSVPKRRKPSVASQVISWLYLVAVGFFLFEVVFGGLWLLILMTAGFVLFALVLAYGTFLAVDSVQMVLRRGEYRRDA